MDTKTYLSATTEMAVRGMLLEYFKDNTKQLDVLKNHVTLTVDALASTVTLTAKAGYKGEVTLAYVKPDFNDLVRFVVSCPSDQPLTYQALSTYLKTTYGLLLEENEFRLASETEGLTYSDVIAQDPDPTSGKLDLRVTAKSGRFKEGGQLALYVSGSWPNLAGHPQATVALPMVAQVPTQPISLLKSLSDLYTPPQPL